MREATRAARSAPPPLRQSDLAIRLRPVLHWFLRTVRRLCVQIRTGNKDVTAQRPCCALERRPLVSVSSARPSASPSASRQILPFFVHFFFLSAFSVHTFYFPISFSIFSLSHFFISTSLRLITHVPAHVRLKGEMYPNWSPVLSGFLDFEFLHLKLHLRIPQNYIFEIHSQLY